MLNGYGFTAEIDGRHLSDTDGFRHTTTTEAAQDDGSTLRTDTYLSEDGTIEACVCTNTYPDSPVIQRRAIVTNRSGADIRLTRIDSLHALLAAGDYTLDYFDCHGNGGEFVPRSGPLAGTKILETTAGRSSRGMHPWFTLKDTAGGILGAAAAWSGNWIFRFEPEDGGVYRITGGLSNWAFAKTLRPGETMEGIPVIMAFLPEGGLDDLSVAFGRWGKRFWYPENEISRSVPVAWNHWWPYEDSAINEDVFKANADVAKELGLEICVLDAGWFGEPNPECNDHLGWSEDVDWYLKRGDWHRINTIRFPSGIAALSEYVRSKGLKFGIWCEIEALGREAEAGKLHPRLPALRDGKHLGYMCMGNPEAVDWAFGVLERLIVDYKAEWLKLDFNLDPCAGCNRTDHGHGEGDGLYEHYRGYYELLSRIRANYPEVYLENCSSGGLRIDLGLARHTHGAFLSDPDFTRHHLQLLWGATQMLHPSACYHFSWSQTIVYYASNVDKDPIKPDMTRERLDYIIRANMLNGFGVSYRLPELPDWIATRLKELVAFYKNTARRFVGQGDMHRLTGQTLRDGHGGDKWNAYLFTDEGAGEGLLFAFRLAGGEAERTLVLRGLDASAEYELRFEDSGRSERRRGSDLLSTGLVLSGLKAETSEVILLRKV